MDPLRALLPVRPSQDAIQRLNQIFPYAANGSKTNTAEG